jgi:RHS repeat-associated protein
MLIRFALSVFLIFLSLGSLRADQMSAVMLPSTESDPDSFIAQCVNVINGDYCETVLDLEIAGPDALTLQRYYNSKNYMTGKDFGGWRIFPQTLLVTGRDPQNKECKVGPDRFEWVYAFTGERSGGILSYSGWRKISGETKDPLKIEILKDTAGMVNSFAGEMSGQTNHLNNRMHFKQETCELILGDGTKRIYQKVKTVPPEIFGEEIALNLAVKLTQPQYFLLISETLPSGNVILFSYDEKGYITSVEMKDTAQKKTHSWMHFGYDFNPRSCRITVTTSDEKKLIYEFEKLTLGKQAIFVLKDVKGNYGIPISYDYAIKGSNNCFLIKKRLPEGRFVEIEYDDIGRVKALKGPSTLSGKPETAYSFNYGDKCTEVSNAAGIKTRYCYDDRLQLIAMEYLGPDGKLHRTDKKYYGKTKQDTTFLLARTISDATGRIHSYRCFKYDSRGNVLEEKLYGNLTGKQEVALQVDLDGQIINPDHEECHIKTFSYSEDGFNLLTRLGDAKGNKTTYTYDKGSNRLIKKLIYEKDSVKKREFRFYNSDAVCIKTIEDDSSDDDIKYSYGATEKHIIEVKPKEVLPGVGLPEVIEEKAVDLKTKNEILVKKIVNTYSSQGQLLSCATYDSNGANAFTIGKTYNHLGQVTSETDPEGKITSYSYDGIGNQILISIPHENKTIEKHYDYKNNLLQTVESAGTLQKTFQNTYDILGRKIASTDQFGETTHFEYDAFGHLTKVIYPTVLDEYKKTIQPTFSYIYDTFGNVLSIIDPKGYTTYKTYNLRGSPSKIHYPDGSIEMFKYDTEGSLHRSLTRDQIVTVYEYDYLGRVSYEEVSFVREKSEEPFITGREYKYNGFRLSSLRNRYLSTDTFTAYRHDLAGRMIAILQYPYGESENHPQSRKTEIDYDSLGRENKRKTWFDFGLSDYSVECVEYDLLGNVIEKRTEDAVGNIQLRKGLVYDSFGHCVEEHTFSDKPIVKTAYDAFGEPILVTDASGNETKVLIDYGKNSLKKTIINSEGVQTKIDFDALGRTISIIKKDAKGTLLSSQSIFYDSIGNKSLEENAIITDGKQLAVQKTRWVHGPMGRIEELIEAEGSPEEKRTAYSYNTLGKLAAKTLPGAAAPLAYTYTKQGWLSKIQYQEGKNDLLVNNYTYDRRGNIISASALGNQSIERTYNIFNQILQETVKDGEGKYTLKFQYDRKGRVKSIALPDDSSIAYTYDGVFGREVKRLSARGEELYSHTYTSYDESGKILEETLIGYCGDRRTHYDLNGRKTLIETDYYTESVPSNGYSTLGNLLSLQRKGDFPTENSSYTYNSLSQLTSEKNSIQKTYSYDSLDNRLKENKDDLLYNSLNQLIAQAKAEFTYDPQGNLLRKTLDGEETQFESNILSQLIAIEKPDQTYLTFSYDPFGRRVVKKTYDSKEKNKKTLSTTRSFYLGFRELGILNEKGAIKKLRVPGISGSQISLKSIAIELEDQTYAVLHDISGNVIALLDPATREIVESYIYSAFGTEKVYNAYQKQISSSAVGNPWRYSEKPIDEETGLICFGFRYYDPSISRWISKDPAGFIDGPNLYAYCHNNPLRCCDPFGLESQVNEEQFYGEVEDHCFCEHHRTCKRGGDLDKTNGSGLPTIKYCDGFEKMYPDYEPSSVYELGLKEIQNIAIGFINGVWNDFNNARANAEHLSKLAGGYNIHAVYNATHGKYPDIKECRMGLNYIATEPVRQLHKMWNSHFEKSSAAAKYLMVCHSQGAIHVRNALLDYPPEFRERIIVVAIAPAAYIYQETCAQVIHIRNESLLRDFIPRIDTTGANRVKDTIMNVQSHPDADRFDHSIISQTYRSELYRRMDNFIKSGGRKI